MISNCKWHSRLIAKSPTLLKPVSVGLPGTEPHPIHPIKNGKVFIEATLLSTRGIAEVF